MNINTRSGFNQALVDGINNKKKVIKFNKNISDHNSQVLKNKAQNHFQSIFENIQDVFFKTKLDGTFIEVSPSVEHYSDISRNELIGTSVFNFYSNPDDRLLILSKLKKDKRIVDFELVIKTPSNEIKYVSINAQIIYGKNVEDNFIVGVIRDLTNRKLVEFALQESEFKYRSVLQTASDAIIIINNESTITSWNDAASKIFGYFKHDILGEHISLILPCSVNEIFKNTEVSGVKLNNLSMPDRVFEHEGITKEGALLPLEISISTWEKAKKKYCTLIIRNISLRKIVEQELIDAKEKAQESDRLKSAFLANMSHEIRTPMNAILGFSDLLMEEEVSIENKNKYLKIINSSGKRLLNIIADIIDVSKIDAKQLTINYNVFNLNRLMDNLYEQFKISKLLKNVNLVLVKPLKDQESYFDSDENRLSQVLSNLLENALKFTSEGTIEFGYSLNNFNNTINIYVKDTGLGIAQKDQHKIFERFGQVETNYLKNTSGSGLGLAIVKGIVELLGGKIEVESIEGSGTNFYFEIPNNFSTVSNTVSNTVSENNFIVNSNQPLKTLLIAEDELYNFLYLKETLSKLNFKILHAINGVEAIEMFRNNTIDLILSDINMPIMSGFEAVKKIRELDGDIPIIALSAYAMHDDQNKIIKAGFNSYLTKPVSKTKLLATVLKYLKQTEKKVVI